MSTTKKVSAPAPVKKDAKDVKKAVATKDVKKAVATKDALVKGVSIKVKKVRHNVHFYRPKTKKVARNPKYPRRSVAHLSKKDKHSIVLGPLSTETAMKKADQNTLVFLCDIRANKPEIKKAVEQLYDLKVEAVNTLIRMDGKKKAYIRLPKGVDALDVANRMGLL